MHQTIHLLLRNLRRSTVPPDGDGELLHRFSAGRDEAAFEELLRRHGSLVLGVCRRLLGDGPDAADAFQAVFLVLSRKAASIRQGNSLPSWLYGVARRIALTARRRALRRGRREPQEKDMALSHAPDPTALDPAEAAADREMRPLLDDELGRLPERYRSALVLCHLKGLTSAEAAAQIGCPQGTLLSRLSRGRDLLRGRLLKRGVVLSAAALTVELNRASAVVPALLGRTTLEATRAFAAGNTLTTPAVLLAKEFLRATALGHGRALSVVLLLVSLLGVGYGVSRPVAAETKAPEAPAFAVAAETPLPTDPAKAAPPPEEKRPQPQEKRKEPPEPKGAGQEVPILARGWINRPVDTKEDQILRRAADTKADRVLRNVQQLTLFLQCKSDEEAAAEATRLFGKPVDFSKQMILVVGGSAFEMVPDDIDAPLRGKPFEGFKQPGRAVKLNIGNPVVIGGELRVPAGGYGMPNSFKLVPSENCFILLVVVDRFAGKVVFAN